MSAASQRQTGAPGTTNHFRVAFRAMLLSLGLTIAMAVPQFDSSGELFQMLSTFDRDAGQREQIVTVSDEKITSQLPQPIIPQVVLDLEEEHKIPGEQQQVPDPPVRNVSTQRIEPAGPPQETSISNFDAERLETRLQKLLEKVDRLEQLQLQQQTVAPDVEEFRLLQMRLSRQLDVLDQRLQSFPPIQALESRDRFMEENADQSNTQSERRSLTPKRSKDESSPETIQLPRIIPNGTPR